MQIYVSQQDIDNGIHGNNTSCPVARAVKRQVKGAKNVSVGLGAIDLEIKTAWWKQWFGYATKNVSVKSPHSVFKFVLNYDAYNDGELTKPFSFELPI